MGVKADFDTGSRQVIITEAPVIPSGAIVAQQTLDIEIDLYSDAKEDWELNVGGNKRKNKFPFTTAQSAGSPLPGGQVEPAFFRFRNDLGWRILPYDSDHELTLLGNIVPADSSLPIFAPRSGRTILIFRDGSQVAQMTTSTTIDAVSQVPEILDIHGQVRRAVFIDTEQGINGNGYQQSPYNNWTDGVDYAEAIENNLKDLFVVSDATVDRQLKNFTIEGIGLPTIDLNAQIMDKSIFRLCGLTGSYSGDINAIECALINLSGLNGVLFTVNAFGTLRVAPGGNVTIWDVKQAFAGLGWGLDMNTGTISKAAIHESVGDVTVINMDDTNDLLEYNGTGDITFSSSCVAGTARVTGDVRITDNSGPLCNVIDETDSKRTEEMHTRLGLEKGNAWTDTPAQSGDDNGNIVIDNTGDGETTSTGTRQ